MTIYRLKDPRINSVRIMLQVFFIALAAACIICVCCLLVNYDQTVRDRAYYYFAMVLFSYAFSVSVVITALFVFVWYKVLMPPIINLSTLAKDVAKGNFDVKLPSPRKDGKNDLFDVLYEDFGTMLTELKSVEMLKTEFVSNISHELKTPLAVIQNYATMMQSDGITAAEQKDYATRIYGAAERLTSLVTDILQLNRLQNQRIEPQKSEFNLSEQLCRCALAYETDFDGKNIELVTELDSELVLSGDERLLDVVWNNLLSNAVKFTDNGGTIKLTAERDGDSAAVRVIDNGCGMTDAEMRHIFDKFYQADGSHATEGNGLGLALVKNIVDIIGGNIAVESAPAVGSVFTVRIPLK